eukprot:CAMPEP_0174822380 /NCGR_PEP_ID=MMETSP1107-20130205/15307_1 /TAXON_ID=36770 /ORGANISM="Paraphysomonas vestita, Strain GFlagA" /LENGTH=618 /DNA_ID=CAMNT_0016041103 /DNA_START=103 /DNA_END=1956 /DNA_ORIENTATION=-
MISESERAAIDSMWGFDKIRGKVNEVIEISDAVSAKYERRAVQEQKKWLEDLEQKFVGDEDDGEQISAMTLPNLESNSNERDVHVHNFTITYGGKILLEGADLRLVCGRRYGLVGRNGVGKTTLLKHMANFDIEGFPTHHRVLHVKQEVKTSEDTVLQVVLKADVERNDLLAREKDLLEKQDKENDATKFQQLSTELSQVYERMAQIGADSAEARAASILTGLQFTEEMQNTPTSALSGGWRMRVALAGALFIEPDILMLDEPTNHLDLEAVLWLQEYLNHYKNTILLVSHDRAFLNEICTDIILFKNLKLHYYRGNFDLFESTRREELLVQQRQYDTQMAKINHMQEFVDKFRYNAKRASLVQSRIKAIEREDVVEAVEEDTDGFRFFFEDAGQLGRPIIQIEGITFGYGTAGITKPLFRNVHLSLDQSSRVALVGPNGAGKSTLLNIIQGKLVPNEGNIHINPQLRISVFTQHHMDDFDLSASPLSNMMKRWPKATEPELRAHLGKYEVTGNDALKPMKFSSGGQKSRVAFACLTFAKPHIVLLDEPTNHLDMEAIGALIGALQKFTGGVLVISHDQYFISQVCNEIWVVNDQTVRPFNGDIQQYKRITLQKKNTS